MQGGLKISKWGNGQGIRIPKTILKVLSLDLDDELIVEIKDQTIILTPKKKRKISLAEKFKNFNGSTAQEEYWTDDLVGKEVF